MNERDILAVIVKNTREVIPELKNHEIQPDDQLKNLGANSVDRAEIVMMTMEDLSLQIPRTELFGAKNISDLARIFYEKM